MEVIKYLLYFLTILYIEYLLLDSYSKISNNNKKVAKKINFSLIFCACLYLCNNLFNLTEYKIIISFIIIILSNLVYFKDDIKEIIQNSVIIVVVNVIVELLFTIIFLNNANNVQYLNDNIILKILFSILVFYITNKVIGWNKINNGIFKIKEITNKVVSIEIIFLLMLVVLNILGFIISEDFDNIYSICSIVISLIYIIFTTFSIVKRQYNIKKLEAKNKELTESYKNYTKAFDDFRELKHNLKNDLYSIKAVVPKEKQMLLNNLITKYNKKYDWLNDLDNIPEGLEGILYLKQNEAKNNKVNLIINYDSKSKILDKDFLDLCDVLGILLDNAIESSKKTKNKIVMLDVGEDKNFINIKIMNNYNNDININELYKKDYSTKEQKSGLGLYYIDKLKNKNIKVSISVINNLFIVTVKYKKISK